MYRKYGGYGDDENATAAVTGLGTSLSPLSRNAVADDDDGGEKLLYASRGRRRGMKRRIAHARVRIDVPRRSGARARPASVPQKTTKRPGVVGRGARVLRVFARVRVPILTTAARRRRRLDVAFYADDGERTESSGDGRGVRVGGGGGMDGGRRRRSWFRRRHSAAEGLRRY